MKITIHIDADSQKDILATLARAASSVGEFEKALDRTVECTAAAERAQALACEQRERLIAANEKQTEVLRKLAGRATGAGNKR